VPLPPVYRYAINSIAKFSSVYGRRRHLNQLIRKECDMIHRMHKAAAAILLGSLLAMPLLAQETAQERHDRAVRSQHAHDARHHTTAKVVGGSAAGGAVIGAVAGGGKGALIGGAVGAGGGLVADHVRKSKGVKKREREER
jgi:hypothetical protein